jgi:hypothetical protein
MTKQIDSTSNSSDLFLGFVEFECLLGHLLRFGLDFLNLSRITSIYYLKLGHNNLPHPLQCITYWSAYTYTLYDQSKLLKYIN